MVIVGEKIIGIFKYGAKIVQGKVSPIIEIKALAFTDSSLFTINAPIPKPIPTLKEKFTTEPEAKVWENLRQNIRPEVDRSDNVVTKDMLQPGNASIQYDKVKKIEIFEYKKYSRLISEVIDVAFVGGLFSGVDFYVPKSSVEIVKELIKETPVAQLLPTA